MLIERGFHSARSARINSLSHSHIFKIANSCFANRKNNLKKRIALDFLRALLFFLAMFFSCDFVNMVDDSIHHLNQSK